MSPYPEFNSETYIYRGEDCVNHFLDCIENIEQLAYDKLHTVKDMKFTESDYENFVTATSCGICLKPFENDSALKVPDHDHISGLFRCAAHGDCNLKMQQQKSIIIFMHNAKG